MEILDLHTFESNFAGLKILEDLLVLVKGLVSS